jgi:hypothetical protein
VFRTRIAALLFTASAAFAAAAAYVSLERRPPAPAPDFTLTDTDGLPFRLSQQRRPVVIEFGSGT